jgi:hypothetical protein
LFSFITNKPLWANILAAVLMTLLLVVLFLLFLGVITRHGEYLQVPSVSGMKTREAISFLEKKGFDVVIQDSVYTDTAANGVVLRQLPDPNNTVKVNRTVYLTVNRVAMPDVEMPSLEGKSFSFALDVLKRNHLQLGDTLFKPDFMKGSVLEQLYNGKRIATGGKLPWGSRITLVLGTGLSDEKIQVPNLIGLSFEEASILLGQYGLSTGALVLEPGVTDTAAAFVYKQDPPAVSADGQPVYIQPGQWMDVWLSAERKSNDTTEIK